MTTACGMHSATINEQAEYIGNITSGKNEIEVKLPHESGFINIIAVVPLSKNYMLGMIPYDPTEILITHRRSHGINQLIFWGTALILLVAIITSIYFYKKFKKVKQELQYEMSDVRNVASVSSGSIEISALSSRNRTYSPLVEEN